MYLAEFLTVAVVHLLAVMSPGPDFAMVTRNSLVYSRRVGLYSAIGLGFGILVHVAYSLIGIGLIVSQSVVLYSIIKFLGAGYLIYIGYKSLKAKPEKILEDNLEIAKKKDLSSARAIWMAFLTNVLNPKATLFFLSLFTQVISPETPLIIQIAYGLEMAIATAIWFALVATVFSHGTLKKAIHRVKHRIEHVTGAVLIALGIKVAVSEN